MFSSYSLASVACSANSAGIILSYGVHLLACCIYPRYDILFQFYQPYYSILIGAYHIAGMRFPNHGRILLQNKFTRFGSMKGAASGASDAITLLRYWRTRDRDRSWGAKETIKAPLTGEPTPAEGRGHSPVTAREWPCPVSRTASCSSCGLATRNC